jgi:hypothetical protein
LWIIALFHCLPNMLTEKLKLITNCFFFGHKKSKNKAAKNWRESKCASDFQNPKDEDSCLELDMMSVYMKFLVRFFPEILIPWHVVLAAYPDSHLGDICHYQMRWCEPLCHSMKWENFQVIFSCGIVKPWNQIFASIEIGVSEMILVIDWDW